MKIKFRTYAIFPLFLMLVLYFIMLPFILSDSGGSKTAFIVSEIVLGIITIIVFLIDYLYLWKRNYFGLSFNNKGYKKINSELKEEQIVGCKKILYSYGDDGTIQTFSVGKHWIMVEGCNNNSAQMTTNGLGPFTEKIKDARRSYSATHMFFCIDDISSINFVKKEYLSSRTNKPVSQTDETYSYYEVCYKNGEKEYIRLGLTEKVDKKRIKEICDFLNKGIKHELESVDLSEAFDADDYIDNKIENKEEPVTSDGLIVKYCPICDKKVYIHKEQNQCPTCGHSFEFNYEAVKQKR